MFDRKVLLFRMDQSKWAQNLVKWIKICNEDRLQKSKNHNKCFTISLRLREVKIQCNKNGFPFQINFRPPANANKRVQEVIGNGRDEAHVIKMKLWVKTLISLFFVPASLSFEINRWKKWKETSLHFFPSFFFILALRALNLESGIFHHSFMSNNMSLGNNLFSFHSIKFK